MNDTDWTSEFRQLYQRAGDAWEAGKRTPATMFNAKDREFLATIGCTAQELFDFVDDELRYGEPDVETVLAIQKIRFRYFTTVLGGKSTGHTARMEDLPPKAKAVDGIPWLLRLIEKARLKLRGEMPDDLMYGCAGDRPFLREMNMDLPQFLQLVWDCGDDDRRIIDTVKGFAGRR